MPVQARDTGREVTAGTREARNAAETMLSPRSWDDVWDGTWSGDTGMEGWRVTVGKEGGRFVEGMAR
jgi:hypothetical protein